jgi:hypothetical protein
MMSYTASAAWSRPVSSPCYNEHGPRCAAVMSGCITTVAMSRSGQLGLRCTVEPNYSGIFARLAGASVTRDRALETCEPSCVPGTTRPFCYCGPQPVGGRAVHSSTGALLSGRQSPEPWDTW